MEAGDIATWLGVVAGLGGFIFAIWKFGDYKISSGDNRVSEKANAAMAKAEVVQAELAAHKLHVAEHYATKQGLTEHVGLLTKAVNDVGDRIDKRLDGMTDRLDRVIEASHKPIRRHSE